jgi:hypothetical protein
MVRCLRISDEHLVFGMRLDSGPAVHYSTATDASDNPSKTCIFSLKPGHINSS